MENTVLKGIWLLSYKEVHEITENAKYRNIKTVFFCTKIQTVPHR